MPPVLPIAISVGVVCAGIYLLRVKRARSWGYCSLLTRLDGKVILITGGNTGLGRHAALKLAARGATIILACRDVSKAKVVAEQIRKNKSSAAHQVIVDPDVHCVPLDLGSLASVKDCAKEINAKFPKLDAVVLNAGIWVPMERGDKTADGVEAHVGVNHLGHFYLMDLLKSKLQPESRVVVVSSSLMSGGKLDFNNFDIATGRKLTDEELDPAKKKKSFAPTGYMDSKLMNALYAKELSWRLAGQGVHVSCICPGWCYTDLSRHVSFPLYKKVLFAPIAAMFLRSGERGSHNIVNPILEKWDNLGPSGGFYKECKLAQEEDAKLNAMEEDGKRLWNLSEKIIKERTL